MPFEPKDLFNLLPGIITQARDALAGLRLAEERLIPPEVREADEEADRQAAVLDQNYCRLLWLTNSLSFLLSLSREAEPHLRDVNLADQVGELCEQAAGLGESMGLEFRFICARAEVLCAVDWDALECILLHLLSNAFRYTPKGGLVTVELRAAGQRILLSVQDSGPGIPEEQRDSIFLIPDTPAGYPPFHGAGLGLPLCSCLARRQGAALLLDAPSKGRGARFTLSLPARTTGELSASLWDFSSGMNHVLLGLSDVLPAEAFRIRNR